MKSPLTGNQTIFEREIESSKIIGDYKSHFGYDISYLLNDIKQIEIQKCLDTGYRFFYPFNISGDSLFYEHLQSYEWYYMPWKWEHQQALQFIKPNMKVLEVGCGNGLFLKRIKEEKCAICTGLELNKDAVEIGKKSGINILNESIENHSVDHKDEYDIVCIFQVLEHISNVRSFLLSLIRCLKSSGILIISVPNNDSFLNYGENILNMPPHHMGLWNKRSLFSLKEYFPIVPEYFFLEPLQNYHKDYFRQTTLQYINRKFKIPIDLLDALFPFLIKLLSKNYKAFTIQVIFRKNEIS